MTDDNIVRQSMLPVSRGLRAYFAPIRREDGSPTIFDPAKYAQFDLDAAPAPWLDAGWIDAFKRTSETKHSLLRSGKRGATATQYRCGLGARLDLEFRQWGKLQMAMAAGSEHLNILEGAPDSADAPGGGGPHPAVIVQPGSTASEIKLGVESLAQFSVGDIVSVDVDYQQQTGYIGTGVAAGFFSGTDERPQDLDYIRRVTFNVARVASKTSASLLLSTPLIGGDPLAAAGIQKVVGFVDREGGSYFQEWSALFVLPEASGGRIYFYYPRLQSAGAPAESETDLGAGLALNSLRASFIAMPIVDSCDGEAAVCYRTYIPSTNAGVLV